MTSSLPRERHRGRNGFTLIEMLVVMGIILLLLAILLPAINIAYKNSVRSRMQADLQLISQGIEEYKNTFGDYPRAGSNISGAAILCWALVAPGGVANDGFAGPGFRLRATQQGTVYGPYVSVDRFQLSSTTDGTAIIEDYYGNSILYFPSNKSVSPTVSLLGAYTPGTIPPTSTFNWSDNSGLVNGTLTQTVMSHRLGDTDGDGKIDNGEIAPSVPPYILWSPGPDGKFGPVVDGNGNVISDDDVTYPELNPLQIGSPP